MKIADLLDEILKVAEKAAQLARAIRSEEALFKLLVEEKTGDSKNKRFVEDFKTLADVLVQELVRHQLSEKFPGIEKNVFGEESNEFTNTLGETLTVKIMDNAEETQAILDKVLDGNSNAANILARVIHSACTEIPHPKLSKIDTELSIEDVGIWIDPIDSTAQYISGQDSKQDSLGVHAEGLQCVVVLIGVYHTRTGAPIAGVINQPFAVQGDKGWHGRSLWGHCYDDVSVCDVAPPPGIKEIHDSLSDESNLRNSSTHKTIIMSTSESQQLQDKFKRHFNLSFAAGAGYKILCVIDGLVSAYFLSKGSTFKWDTCGPHAILKAFGGGIVDLESIQTKKNTQDGRGTKPDVDTNELPAAILEHAQLVYNKPDSESLKNGDKWSNSRGIIAYKESSIIGNILNML